MDAPDFLAGHPWWAYAIFIAFAGITWAVKRYGERLGRTQPSSAPPSAEVVALSVDSRALDRLTGELAGHAVALSEAVAVGKKVVALFEEFVAEKRKDRAEEDFDEAVAKQVAAERAHERSTRELEAEVARRVAAELERVENARKRPSPRSPG